MPNSNPTVSVLVTTFNRSKLLQRALASILKQDYHDYEIVVVDDHSSDDTQQVMEGYTQPCIRYIRNPENVAGTHGDRALLKRFVDEYARGKFFVYLCDDDFWIPANLLRRQVDAMSKHPDLAMVIGGQLQIYPNELLSKSEVNIHLANIIDPGETGLHLGDVPANARVAFAKQLFPPGHHSSSEFLQLFAENPAERNLVVGATMFNRAAFRKAQVFEVSEGSKWQAGYELIAGAATAGDVFYIDEPCVASLVDLQSASFRGTQLQHLQDCLLSIDIAFRVPMRDAGAKRRSELNRFRTQMMHSILYSFLMNKVTYRFGGFSSHAIADIEKIFKPEISTGTFKGLIQKYDIPLWRGNRFLLRFSMLPRYIVPPLWKILAKNLGPYWHQTAMKYPSNELELMLSGSIRHYRRRLNPIRVIIRVLIPVEMRNRLREFFASLFKPGGRAE